MTMRLDEWCDTCKEYDQQNHSCPRFNRVIRETLDDVRKEAYKHGKSKGIKKGLAMAQPQRWIPCSERLPENGLYLITGKKGSVYPLRIEDGRWYGGIKPVAWMSLPEPYEEQST